LSSGAAGYDILIVGGGEAGRCAAEAARAADAGATIAIVGEEAWLPYDRPPLSKGALTDPAGIESCQKRDRNFYADSRIDLLLGRRVAAIDVPARTARLDGGEGVAWRKLVLATGSRPRHLALPEAIGGRVHYLRTRDDAARLSAALAPGAAIGIVGAGFIGLEVAASARARGCRVTVFERAPSVLARVMPADIARDIEAVHAGHDVVIRTNVAVEVDGTADGVTVSATDLANGARSAGRFDALLVAVGIVPNVELAAEAGVAVGDGIVVDASGRTSVDGVFAAGEVTNHPVATGERRARYESWQVAQSQAAAVGSTAAGVVREYREIPWFWSDQYDLNIQMLGHASPQTRWVFRGDRAAHAFTAFGLDAAGFVEVAISINAGRDIAGARRLISRRIAPDPGKLADPRCAWNVVLSSQPGMSP
jgi:NADPH-dependent 2,4-dienoyl-CoA reductase/sulfur reductase-like enzyme